MRTTLDIEKPVLDDLKKLQAREKKPLGHLASALLAQALKEHQLSEGKASGKGIQWHTSRMGAKVDISDKDALYAALDES